jgi:hypothetical protein
MVDVRVGEDDGVNLADGARKLEVLIPSLAAVSLEKPTVQ